MLVYSIIVPVYNAENTIDRLIDSVLKQTYRHFELIIINDGSNDKTQSILNFRISQDNRIKVFNQKNEGVSSARNKGLLNSSGDVILFADSDDELDRNLLEMLNSTFQNSENDIVIYGYKENYEDDDNYKLMIPKNKGIKTKDLLVKKLMNDNRFSKAVWNKAFKRGLVFTHEDSPILFSNDVFISEDCLWISNVFSLLTEIKVVVLSKALYIRHLYSTGITQCLSPNSRIDPAAISMVIAFERMLSLPLPQKSKHYIHKQYLSLLRDKLLFAYEKKDSKVILFLNNKIDFSIRQFQFSSFRDILFYLKIKFQQGRYKNSKFWRNT